MKYFDVDGFYDDAIHSQIPPGAVELSDEEYAALKQGQQSGFEIVRGEGGKPELKKPVALPQQSCTPAQGLVALFALKQITEAHLLEAITQISDPMQQYTARIGYQHATTWERSSPTMRVLAQLLQLSEQDLDALFTYAVTVQV